MKAADADRASDLVMALENLAAFQSGLTKFADHSGFLVSVQIQTNGGTIHESIEIDHKTAANLLPDMEARIRAALTEIGVEHEGYPEP